MPSPAEIVEQYFDAWTSKDFETARSLLHDDLSFVGPIERVEQIEFMRNAGMPLVARSHKRFTEIAPTARLAYTSLVDFVPTSRRTNSRPSSRWSPPRRALP
jgi:ketosteroid isomerase-like protein